MEAPRVDWHPHPTVLRATAYAACFVVVAVALGLLITMLGRLGIVLFPVVTAIFLTRVLDVPNGWLLRRGWRPAPAASAVLIGFIALLGVLESVIIGSAMGLTGASLVVPVMLLTFAAAFVPLVGATVAGVIAVVVTLASAGLTEALIVMVVAILVQQFDNDLLAPWIYGKALDLHPAVILLSIASGTALFGIAGALLAVPTVAITINGVVAYRSGGKEPAEGPDGGNGADPPPEVLPGPG